jgi:hypothetical protein
MRQQFDTLGFAATSHLETELSRAQSKRRDTGSIIPKIYALIPHQFNDNMGMSDDDTNIANWTNLEAKLTIVWVSNKIFKEKRQDWILQKARAMVTDHKHQFGIPIGVYPHCTSKY